MLAWLMKPSSRIVPPSTYLYCHSNVSASRADTFEWQYKYVEGGTMRLLGFINQANMGTYRLGGDDITATRKPGTIKYRVGLNVGQKIPAGVGVFGRAGWNDGKTESWAFTEIDRTVSGGVSIKGVQWHRKNDVLGIAGAVNAISGDHRAYLARGGSGFLIGDGKLPNAG